MPKVYGFSINYPQRVNVIKSECKVSQPHLESEINKPDYSNYVAIWDTGATGTVISKQVAADLGLQPTGKKLIHHANGTAVVYTYIVNIELPNDVKVYMLNVTEGVLAGCDLLIGMDIINQGDFTISNFQDQTTFSFRTPSIQHIMLDDFLIKMSENIQKNVDPYQQNLHDFTIDGYTVKALNKKSAIKKVEKLKKENKKP